MSSRAPEREIYGIIGKIENSAHVQASWNAYFSKNTIDAFMAKYPTTVDTLQERLSEMFTHDRRLYIVSASLSKSIVEVLDVCNSTPVNLILNRSGILHGMHFDGDFTDVRSVIDLL